MLKDLEFIINKFPVGLIIYNNKLDIVYLNKKALLFLDNFSLPEEIKTITNRIFDSIKKGKFEELFPGEIHLTKKLDGSESNWLFRIYVNKKIDSLVYILIFEETLSNKLDMNYIRQQYRLTRRETDILRRVLDGYKNSDIAKELDISEQTVKDHLSNIYSKTETKNRMELIRQLIYLTNNQN